MLPDEEPGAANVVRVGEADEGAVALRAPQREQGQGAIPDAAAAIEQLHAEVGAGVAAGVAILDAARDAIGGRRRGPGRLRGGGAKQTSQEHAADHRAGSIM